MGGTLNYVIFGLLFFNHFALRFADAILYLLQQRTKCLLQRPVKILRRVAALRAAETIGRPGAPVFLDCITALTGHDPRADKRGGKPPGGKAVGRHIGGPTGVAVLANWGLTQAPL
jgi:hypothetical protein